MSNFSEKLRAGKNTYIGLFLITMATLMYEILLTRIFSVTMWYHYAFVAISVALFGMTAGATLVYLFPGFFTRDKANRHLSISSVLFALTIIFSFLTHLTIPFITEVSFLGFYGIALTYVVISVPFIFSGIGVCISLTKFPRQVSALYAFDLAGAAFGCILIIYVIDLTGGPTAVMIVSFIASLGAIFFSLSSKSARLKALVVVSCIIIGVFSLANAVLNSSDKPLIRIKWVKGKCGPQPLYECWNSFSRVIVFGNPDKPGKPFGWAISKTFAYDYGVRELTLSIDGCAGTILTNFEGNFSLLQHLKYDVTNIAHYIVKDADVMVVGAGGGRDILSALVFDQKAVTGVEINDNIIDAVDNVFGDFTGHLDRNPKVTIVNDEARSFIARQDVKFDIIQISLIDTWAATAEGAFVLAENSLYTTEAWTIFLDHLREKGVLSVTRWHYNDFPAETYRLTSLAASTLKQIGVEEPRKHIIIVKNMGSGKTATGTATTLISRSPFTTDALHTIKAIAEKMQFELVLTPDFAEDENFELIASGSDISSLAEKMPYNIEAPTDENPFFFQMLKMRHAFDSGFHQQGRMQTTNQKAVFVLVVLLIIVIMLTILFIIGPLAVAVEKKKLKATLSLSIYFSCIGFGFMLVEISLMQRLIIFLGHPTYGLAVVLFSLLLSGGLGSFSTQLIKEDKIRKATMLRLAILLLVLAIVKIMFPHLIRQTQACITPTRILIAAILLFPMGFFMGMAFPTGMRLASLRNKSIMPWLWGINGATSVCASVIAIVIAIAWSISTAFWTGFACYFVALAAYAWASRRKTDAVTE